MTALRVSRSRLASILATSAAVAGLLHAGGASAAGSGAAPTLEVDRVVVQYGDLNLDTERGAAALQRRIANAARQVCGSPNPRELVLYRQARECVSAAIERAVDQVGSTRLAELHAGRHRALRG
jgi:UrcA family protein